MADSDAEFSSFVVDRWSRLVRIAMLLGCQRAEAEDLVQTTLEGCLLKWNAVRRADDIDAYVHRVLINVLRRSRRRRWWGEHPTAEVPDTAGPDATIQVDDADTVRRALGRLPDGQRTVIVLRYYAHLSEVQMALALSVAPGTIKSRLSRAMRALAIDPDLTELRELR